jgi:hypothetical protein
MMHTPPPKPGLMRIPRPAKGPPGPAPPDADAVKKKDGYDGPSDGYERARSGYDGKKSGYDGRRSGNDSSRERYDGPESGYDRPDPARGSVKPLTPGRR